MGLLLYEMATGQRPFQEAPAGSSLEAILSNRRRPVRSLNPDIQVELEAIINKAIDKDKELRYQSAAELRSDSAGLESAALSPGTLRVRCCWQPREPSGSHGLSARKWTARVAAGAIIAVMGGRRLVL